jgi:hypothetical protein
VKPEVGYTATTDVINANTVLAMVSWVRPSKHYHLFNYQLIVIGTLSKSNAPLKVRCLMKNR